MTDDRVTYLYGFVPPAAALPERGLLGIEDAEVTLLPVDGFAAVTARLPADRFAGEPLEARSGDVEWMAEVGLRHEQVVAWFVDHASILPSRLLTLFSSDEALRQRASAEAPAIRDALARFDGLREWDLKVGYDAERIEERLAELSPEVAALDAEIGEAAPGRRFLLEKKRGKLARAETRGAAARLAASLLETLRPFARQVVRLALPADDTPVVLNAALLIARDREEEAVAAARAEIARTTGLGLDATLTGPWAPYRFLEADHDG